MSQVELHHGAATDVGLVREINEDAYLVAPPVFVVADGMGGHENGDVASRIVVEEFARLADEGYDPTPRRRGRHRDAGGQPAPDRGVRRARRRAGRGARRAPPWSPRCWSRTTAPRPGCWPTSATRASTLSAAASCDQVSIDHSVVQELVDSGEITAAEAHEHPERHVDHPRAGRAAAGAGRLLRAAGRRGRSGCCCAPTGSAGWSTTTEIAAILAESPDPRDAADRLVEAALRRRGSTTTPPPSSSMWWDWSPTRPTTPSDSARVSSRSWEHCREPLVRLRALLPARRLVRDRRRARRRDPAAHREAAGGRRSGSSSTAAPASTSPSTR